MRKIIPLSIIFILFITNHAFAFWIWTPKTGKWVNPKYAVKPTPAEQLKSAVELYEEDKLKEARREFKKLLDSYSKSSQAAEAQYYLGMIEEEKGRLYQAYLAYQKVIDKYPFSSRIDEIIEKEFRIAVSFLEGGKRKTMGLNLPLENPAIEILSKVIDNSTYGPWAAEAQYKLGLILKNEGRFPQAQEEFNKLIKNYPQSEWVTASKFQIASCRASISAGPQYDQEATHEAKKQFEEFIYAYPEAALSRQAEKNIRELREREAQGYYDSAVFYEKQKAYNAARIYYNMVIKDYPQSSCAAEALLRVQEMEQKNEKNDKDANTDKYR